MITGLRLSIGCEDENTIWIDWSDEDHVQHLTKLEVNTKEKDRSTRLLFLVNGHDVAIVRPDGHTTLMEFYRSPEQDIEMGRVKNENVRLSAEVACLKRNLRHDAEIVQNLHEIMANRLI